MIGVGQGRRRQGSQDQLAAVGENDPVLRAIVDGFIAGQNTLCYLVAKLELAVKARAKNHPVAKLLITILGVGPKASQSFVALVGDLSRFSKTSDVGASLGLTRTRHPSGELDWSRSVFKFRDAAMCGVLFEAVSCVIQQVKRFCFLKSWAIQLAGRRGFRGVAVATARKIAVLMLTLWKTETNYQWTEEATAGSEFLPLIGREAKSQRNGDWSIS
jgi:hypothetical protein